MCRKRRASAIWPPSGRLIDLVQSIESTFTLRYLPEESLTMCGVGTSQLDLRVGLPNVDS
jgi:hypothetical protein